MSKLRFPAVRIAFVTVVLLCFGFVGLFAAVPSAVASDSSGLTRAEISTPDGSALVTQADHSVVVKLNKTKVYVGQRPNIKVVLIDGKTANYNNLSFSGKIPQGVGFGSVIVQGKKGTSYEGISKTVQFKVVPYGTSLNSVTALVGGFKATWSAQTSYTAGYQLQYSTSSNFKSSKTFTVKNNGTVSKKKTGLKEKTMYYVRIRTYADTSGGRVASPWSNYWTVTTKATVVPKYQPTQKLSITNMYRSENYCVLSWTRASDWYYYSGGASSKVSGYELQYSDSPYFKGYVTTRTTKEREEYNYQTTTLSKGTTYYFRVRLFNTVNAKTYYGPWSAVRSTATAASGSG